MATHTTVERLESLIGHDGSEVVYPDLSEPQRRRGFHVQELIDAALRLDYSVTPFEVLPQLAHPQWATNVLVDRVGGNWERFDGLIETQCGVLTGCGRHNQHAVAIWRDVVLDPDGWVYRYSRERCGEHGFYPQCLWIIEEKRQ